MEDKSGAFIVIFNKDGNMVGAYPFMETSEIEGIIAKSVNVLVTQEDQRVIEGLWLSFRKRTGL